MSDAYLVRFNRTDGGEFLLDGEDYVGLFNVYSDGSVMTGRYRTPDSRLLEKLSNISADYYTSSYQKDLVVYDSYSMPHSRSDIQINMNELVNFTTLNTKMRYIHENMMYVYSRMFYGDTDVPFAYDKTACISNLSGTFGWFDTPNYTSYGYSTFASNSSLSAYAEIDNIKRFVVIPFDNAAGYGIIGISNTHVIGLTSSLDFSNVSLPLFYTDVIDNLSDEKCQSLEDVTFDGAYLYVTDSQINSGGQVFKYDVTSYFTGDPAFEYNRFLIKPIGGLGGKSDVNKFKGCTVIGSKPGVILVADSGNNAIKVFDRNFVWLKTIVLPKGPYKVLDIKHRTLNDRFYALVRNTQTNAHYLYEFNNDLNLVNRTEFQDKLYVEIDGGFNRMVFSENDSNVFYVLTDSTIYKKFFSNPEKTFAVFKRDKFGQSSLFIWNFETVYWSNCSKKWNYSESQQAIKLRDLNILPTTTAEDSLFLLGPSVLFHFSELTKYNSVLRNTKLPYYNLQQIQLELPENIQAATLNKELFKIYSNIIQIKNTLTGRFSFDFNAYGDIEFKNYVYFIENEIDALNVEITSNTRINDNELVQAGTINKLFTKIYDMLAAMLKLTQPRVFNYRSVITNQNVLLIS